MNTNFRLNLNPESPDAQGGTRDRALDENLARIAPGLDLPEMPATFRAQREGQGAGVPTAVHAATPRRPRAMRHRLWTALSGAAAMIAAGAAILFTTQPTSSVKASTILESLRRAQVQGVRFTIRDLKADGGHVDGQIHVRFAEPVNIEAMLDGLDQAEPQLAQAAATLRLRLGDSTPVPGLDLNIDAALSEGSTWVHARSAAAHGAMPLPAGEAGNPLVFMASNMLRGGALLDFGAGVPGRLNVIARQHGQHGHAPAAPGAGTNEVERKAVDVYMKAGRGERAEGAGDGEAASARAGVRVSGLGDSLPVAVRRFLTGEAGQAELDEVLRLLREGDGTGNGPAEEATIDLAPTGEYILTASLREPQGRRARELACAPVMRIAYAPGTGVQWLELDVTGAEAGLSGVVRIDFLTSAIDPALFDKSRVMVDGRTAVLTEEMLRAWMPMMGVGDEGE